MALLESRKLARIVLAAFIGLFGAAIVWRMTATHSVVAGAGGLSFDWSMQDRFGATNADGIIDESPALNSSYINPTSWNLTFDACSSGGPGTYTWKFTKSPTVLNANGGCNITQALPSLGTWSVTVKQMSGSTVIASFTQSITPVDKFVVSVGDSVASGEGSPDTVGAKS